MFKLDQVSNFARVGVLDTTHGKVQTPAFMPVATKGYVKTVTPDDLIAQGTEVIIANSFLLYLKPGLDVITPAGGLHRFMKWPRVIFTDSGGFQMIRPDFHAKVDERGITFQSPFDGSKHLFTPEKCIETQVELGIDVAMILDHCPNYGSPIDTVSAAVEQTTAWAKRSITKIIELRDAKIGHLPQFFGIVQGGIDPDLRTRSAHELTELDFDGFGIGGLSIGEPKSDMYKVLRRQVPLLPNDKPRYLMGVGSPQDLIESISLGVDIFDSVFPTRNARHGTIHTIDGNININRAPYSKQFTLLDDGCRCETCKAGFTRAYINHLIRNYSILGMRLATVHNLHFIQHLLRTVRKRIKEGTFPEFKLEFIERFSKTSGSSSSSNSGSSR
jgi:queuine tRNA-ribosyltransferase